MKKFLCLVFAFLLLTNVCYAEEYSTQLEELRSLLAQCEAKNISTPYETVGVSTFEKFVDYLKEDADSGVDESIMTYNENAMQKIYNDTKENLEGYLSGAKIPLRIPSYDMMKTEIDGTGITDGKNKVISVGYGHFNQVRNEIENLNNFGAYNIQAETGPSRVIAIPGWSHGYAGSPEFYFDVVNEDSNRAFKMEYKSQKTQYQYFCIEQTVNVKPSETYYFYCSTKGKNVADGTVSVDINGSRQQISGISSDWKNTVTRFTTDSNTSSFKLRFYIEAPFEELSIDNVFIGTSENGENLVTNGDFESGYDEAEIADIRSYLERAEQSNVAVSFLLQPMYFWRILDCEDLYSSATGTSYNVNDERARVKLAEYIKAVVPVLDEYEAVRDICLTNEPTINTRQYPDFYNPKFREYLLEEYGSLQIINSKYGKSYSSIDEIVMPEAYSKSAIFYDWICFNEDMCTQWNKWMADEVRKYTDKPLHSKMMSYIIPDESDDRKELTYGTDAEKFGEFLDYAGNDASCSITWEPSMVTKMMWYDYLHSVVGKPVYNSEDHFIKDGSTTYSDAQKNIVRYNLWQGAVHNRSISTMWVWRRSNDPSSIYSGSILHRPDCLAEAGYTSFDIMRNVNDISKLSSKKPEIALFYSKTSRVFNDDHLRYLVRYYQALLCTGKSVGFVTETSLDKLADYKYLIMPNVKYTTEDTITAVNNFIDNQNGKVIYYSGNILSGLSMKNKFGESLDVSKIKSKGRKFTTKDVVDVIGELQNYFSDDRIKIVDTNGKATTNVEYEYVIDGGNVLVNLVYLGEGSIDVSVKLDGNKLSGMKNIVTGEVTADTHTLTGYVPLTLKVKNSTEAPSKPQNLEHINNALYWDDDDNAVLYRVYHTDEKGIETEYCVTENNYCAVSGYGIFKVVAENSIGTKGEAASITMDPPPAPSQLANLKYSNNTLSWDASENAVRYNVYYTDNAGDETLYAVTSDNYCKVSDYGVYTVVPQNAVGIIGPSASITIDAPFDIVFESVTITDNGITASVKVTNKSDSFQKTVIKFKTSDEKVAISNLWLPPMKDWNVKASFSGTAEFITASVSNRGSDELACSVKYEK